MKAEQLTLLKDLLTGSIQKKRAFVGLDGFIDEITAIVDQRLDAEHYTRIQTIAEYGQRILEGSGLSLNLESVVLQQKIGGNGPIYALGLKRFGMGITYIGTVGETEIHPIFSELATHSDDCIIGIAEPAHTRALEFQDGKIIDSILQNLNGITWEHLISKFPHEHFATELDHADVISLNNWTMIPAMNDIWQHILDDILPLCRADFRHKLLFFDLADPRKRSRDDVQTALRLIQRFARSNMRVILGLNHKEAQQIAQMLNLPVNCNSIQSLAKAICSTLELYGVVIHRSDRACCFQNGCFAEVESIYCRNPVVLTGAGDVFNSGFVFAHAQNWPLEMCLCMGCLASGYYVRNAHSASRNELLQFIQSLQVSQP